MTALSTDKLEARDLRNLDHILRDPLSGLTWDNRIMAANAICELLNLRVPRFEGDAAEKAKVNCHCDKLHPSDLCASGQQVRAALEGAVNWLDALLALVQETSCDPDDPEAFDEVVMAAGMWLSRARAALITPTEGGSDAE